MVLCMHIVSLDICRFPKVLKGLGIEIELIYFGKNGLS
jgi:hypothetical protein